MRKNIYTSHKHKAFRHCELVCVFWDFELFWNDNDDEKDDDHNFVNDADNDNDNVKIIL